MPKAAITPQTSLVVQAPAPVMVAPPDVTELVTRYNEVILPLWRKYQDRNITSPEEYTQWNLDWVIFTRFAAEIDTLFEAPCAEAFNAHRTLTGMRGYIKSFPDQGAAYIGAELIRWRKEQERLRIAEEKRLQALENARLEAERQRLQAEADLKHAEAVKDLDPWEIDDPPPVIEIQTAAPVRLPSSVSQILGGPRMVDKPWACRVTDPVALLKWVLELPDERLIYISWNLVELNRKARELGSEVSRVIDGVTAVKEQTLKRG